MTMGFFRWGEIFEFTSSVQYLAVLFFRGISSPAKSWFVWKMESRSLPAGPRRGAQEGGESAGLLEVKHQFW